MSATIVILPPKFDDFVNFDSIGDVGIFLFRKVCIIGQQVVVSLICQQNRNWREKS